MLQECCKKENKPYYVFNILYYILYCKPFYIVYIKREKREIFFVFFGNKNKLQKIKYYEKR